MAGSENPKGKLRLGFLDSGDAGDPIDYLYELILELRQIADNSGQQTLSAILAAALTEARVQKENREH